VIGVISHFAVHVCALPVNVAVMQLSFDLQLVAVGQAEAGSHVSPLSTAPLPHIGLQSSSLVALAP
jgi:hypothetical protein